jgi:dolichol kinase
VKHQERATSDFSTQQKEQVFRNPTAGRRAGSGRGRNGYAAPPVAGSRGYNAPHTQPNRAAFAAAGAAFPEIAIPSTSERWEQWWGRVVGLFDERLGARETKRRLLHATPGFLPFLLWAIPHHAPSSFRFLSVIAGLIVVLAVVAYFQFGRVQRTAERRRDVMGAVFGYATVVLATMLICSQHVEVAFAALAVLAFGDGSATLGGMLTQGRRLPWNPKKTIVGSLCFVGVATPMAALAYWGEAHDIYQAAGLPRVDFPMALLGALAAAVAAALVESLPVRTNDNLRVGTTAAVVIGLFQWLVVGWV